MKNNSYKRKHVFTRTYFQVLAYFIIYYTIGFLVKIIWVNKVTGRNNIPDTGPVIVASNHTSYMDFLCIASILDRRVYFLAGEVFFNKVLWKLLMNATSQIKLDRYSKDKSGSLLKVNSALEQGLVVGIFPEGTRSLDGKIKPGKNGVSRIAIENQCPVIPIGISGAFEVWPKGSKFPKIKKSININIGEQIRFNEDITEDRLTNIIMMEIYKLTLNNNARK